MDDKQNLVSIIYEDKNIVLCKKPVGVLSQESSEECMPSLLKKSENDYIGVIHRLDRNVGGIMVFAKNKASAGKLSTLVQEKQMLKQYLAVVEGEMDKFGEMQDYLFKDSSKNKVFVVKKMRKGVKEARLSYETLGVVDGKNGKISLVLVTLHTGRTHQIRVQFASRGHSLVGDGKYGSKDNACFEALWCYRLAFEHPVINRQIDEKCLPPKEYPFDLFKEVSYA